MARAKRFVLRTPAGDEPVPTAETPGAVLSKAITRASRSKESGTWEVIEWEDVIYRVHRLDVPELDVRVEVLWVS
ncbi:MAG: hypothetical protein KGL39_15295 [Patescibacteria group bacterium]|nr:hypothetical protein [Patescibacteria group bacterium]